MSGSKRFSEAIKGLITAPYARPNPISPPYGMLDVYAGLLREAKKQRYGELSWLALSAATTMTLNSGAALGVVHHVARTQTYLGPVTAAEFIREVGLKCISFNGIPRTINCLRAFKEHMQREDLYDELEKKPSRALTPANIDAVNQRGRDLWKSVYTPLDETLESRLAESHPDLPVYILGAHYGPLLSDPPGPRGGLGTVGRSLTSIVAISCLRVQGGVAPQVLSHVYGLLKAVEQGAHRKDEELEDFEADGIENLATDEGLEWLLRSADAISHALGGSSFAQPVESPKKLKQKL